MYESPIKLFTTEMQIKQEEYIMEAVQRVCVDVNKEQLIKALQYDRNQYEEGYSNGYSDGYRQAVKEYGFIINS